MSREQQLIDAIRAEPDDRESYIVYGDWLAQRGDPRGELIGFHAALERDPDDRELEARAHELVEEQLAMLPEREHVEARWKLGTICELWIDPQSIDPARVGDLFAHPLLQLVESVSLLPRASRNWATRQTLLAEGDDNDVHRTLFARVVAAVPPALLRRLEVGHPRSWLFATADELRDLLRRFPRLCELNLHAFELPVAAIAVLAPVARAVELTLAYFSDELMTEIATARWPRLRRLSLELRRTDFERWPLADLMDGSRVPELVDLRVLEARAGDFTERLCTEIVDAPLLRQLEVLDFTFRSLDVQVIRPSYRKLAHLKRVAPSADEETNVDALSNLVWFFDELDPERSAALARRGVAHAKSRFDRHSLGKQLGAALSSLGRLDEGLAALDASLALESNCGMTWLHKARTLKWMGRIEDALEAARSAQRSDKHVADRGTVLYFVGSLSLALGDATGHATLAEAEPLLGAELATDPDCEMLYEHACTLCLLGDHTAALTQLERCLALSRRYAELAAIDPDFATLRDASAFRALLGLA